MTQVNELGGQGRWSEAVGLLQKAGPQSAAHPGQYYYNLGTAALRAGQIGPSLTYLEKAAQLVPGNSDVTHNLEIARKQLGQAIGADRLDPGASTLEKIAADWPLGILAALSSLLGAGLLALRRGDTTRTAGGAAAAALALVLGAVHLGAFQSPSAGVLERTPVRSGPGEQYPQISQVEAGVRVRVGSEGALTSGTWVQVRISDDLMGWIPKTALLE